MSQHSSTTSAITLQKHKGNLFVPNPYKSLDQSKFWKTAVADMPAARIHPRSAKRFSMEKTDAVVTAGSCFAQNVAKYLRDAKSVKFIESELLQADDPVFSGRYGNIYTARQMVQLFDEVQSGSPDADCAVLRSADNRYVDINRPFIEKAGYESPEAVINARADHISAIKPIFQDSDVFVFTLGLTEGWKNPATGKVYPVCPGVYSDLPETDYVFHNFTYEEIVKDMEDFIAKLTAINPAIKILLTVSPVPLTATYTKDDVVTATMHSKAILRTVCGSLESRIANVFYFPSYEMIANPFTAGSAYASNLRSVQPEPIEAVMRYFEEDYIVSDSGVDYSASDDDIVCDDVEIENSVGF